MDGCAEEPLGWPHKPLDVSTEHQLRAWELSRMMETRLRLNRPAAEITGITSDDGNETGEIEIGLKDRRADLESEHYLGSSFLEVSIDQRLISWELLRMMETRLVKRDWTEGSSSRPRV